MKGMVGVGVDGVDGKTRRVLSESWARPSTLSSSRRLMDGSAMAFRLTLRPRGSRLRDKIEVECSSPVHSLLLESIIISQHVDVSAITRAAPMGRSAVRRMDAATTRRSGLIRHHRLANPRREAADAGQPRR